MKKSDLKAGYTLVDERGRNWVLFNTKNGDLAGYMIKNYNIVNDVQLDVNRALNDDLTIREFNLNPACDIVKVYGLPEHAFLLFEQRYDRIDVLWKREKNITLTIEITEETAEEIKKLLNIK